MMNLQYWNFNFAKTDQSVGRRAPQPSGVPSQFDV
jgi:hypothetical protein